MIHSKNVLPKLPESLNNIEIFKDNGQNQIKNNSKK